MANPLKIIVAKDAGGKLTAAEWAAIAREKGLTEHAQRWDGRAMELGEERIPNGVTVRFNDQKEKCRVWITGPNQ